MEQRKGWCEKRERRKRGKEGGRKVEREGWRDGMKGVSKAREVGCKGWRERRNWGAKEEQGTVFVPQRLAV